MWPRHPCCSRSAVSRFEGVPPCCCNLSQLTPQRKCTGEGNKQAAVHFDTLSGRLTVHRETSEDGTYLLRMSLPICALSAAPDWLREATSPLKVTCQWVHRYPSSCSAALTMRTSTIGPLCRMSKRHSVATIPRLGAESNMRTTQACRI